MFWHKKRKTPTPSAGEVIIQNIRANGYAAARQGYEIERREGGQLYAMQYLRGLYTVKDMESPSFEECVAAIPHWITYIQKQSAAMRRALKP